MIFSKNMEEIWAAANMWSYPREFAQVSFRGRFLPVGRIRTILELYRNDIERVFEAVRNLFRFPRSQPGLINHRPQLPTPSIAPGIDGQDSEVRRELNCILTMFEMKMTKAPDSVKVTMEYITEIVWDDPKSVPLLQVYQALCESLLRFADADGKVYPRHGARDKALWSAKALLQPPSPRYNIFKPGEFHQSPTPAIGAPCIC